MPSTKRINGDETKRDSGAQRISAKIDIEIRYTGLEDLRRIGAKGSSADFHDC